MDTVLYTIMYSGLANRIRGLAGYQAMARCLDLPFRLGWIPNADCDAEFGELFDASALTVVTRREADPRQAPAGTRVYLDPPSFRRLWETHLHDTVPWGRFCVAALDCLRGLRPLPHITHRAEAFADAHAVADLPGMHIRWTDNLREYACWSKVGPGFVPECVSELAGFVRFAENHLAAHPGSRVFLATDNRRVEQQMTARFRESLVVFPKTFRRSFRVVWPGLRRLPRLRAQRTSSVEDALVEMLLLARCRLVVGTYYSSFSEISALWGNRPLLQVQGDRVVDTGLQARYSADSPAPTIVP